MKKNLRDKVRQIRALTDDGWTPQQIVDLTGLKYHFVWKVARGLTYREPGYKPLLNLSEMEKLIKKLDQGKLPDEVVFLLLNNTYKSGITIADIHRARKNKSR